MVFIGIKIAQNVGVERATAAQEQAVLSKLGHASARQVLDAWFWGINHHSTPVVVACSHPRAEAWEGIKKLKVLSVREVIQTPGHRPKRSRNDEKCFSVRFRPFNRFGWTTGLEQGQVYEWTFYMKRSRVSRWRVQSYGMC